MSRVNGRALRAAALVAVVATAYGAGVATGGSRSADSSPGVVDEALERIADHAAAPVDKSQLQKAAVDGALAALGDKWSAYYTASEYSDFDDSLDGRYTGVGLWLERSRAGVLTVGAVTDGSPADDGGVKVGDVVHAVGDQSTTGVPVATVANLLRGDAGTTVTLTVARGSKDRVLSLKREALSVDDVAVDRTRDNITVIRVASFTRGVGREVRDAVDSDPAAVRGGVVLDLRGNTGGLITEAVEVASAFLDGGKVVSYERRGSTTRVLDAVGHGDTDVQLVVLVDGGTASASEIVAAALQDRNRAVIVGSRTFGKGSVQEPSELSDGSALELTVGRYLTPSGRAIDGVGIDPDVVVAAEASPGVAERRAIDVLSGLMASVGSGRG